MNYKPYAEYKDSGIEWIGDIPQGWEVKKLKYLCELRNEKTSDENKEYIALEHIESMTGRIIKRENDDIQPEGDSICFYKGDVLFCKLRPYLAKCILAQFDGKCTSELLAMSVNESLNEKYLFYIALSEWFVDVINSSTYGSKMPRASWDFIGELMIAFPKNNDEQIAIANYLDAETAKIASIISVKQKLIEKLQEKRNSIISHAVTKGLDPTAKMKTSGVEWIGDIPEGWEAKKLKYIVSSPLLYGANESPDGTDDGQPRYIRITDIDEKGNLRDDTFVSLEIEKARPYLLKKYDILFARSGATVGKSYIYCGEDEKACFAGYLIKLSLNPNKAIPKFVYYNTLNKGYKSWIEGSTIQATIQNVSAEKYNNFAVGLPTLPEQLAIADYLDAETAKIDAIIAKTKTSIEKLNEYKTALISACVTGKIDVRGEN